MSAPSIQVRALADGERELVLSGEWTLGALAPRMKTLARALAEHAGAARVSWNCLDIATLDSTGAMLLWRAWRRTLPALLSARPEHRRVFARIAGADREHVSVPPPSSPFEWLITLGAGLLRVRRHLLDFTRLLGQLLLDAAHLGRHPSDIPRREISANLYKSGVRAMPVLVCCFFRC